MRRNDERGFVLAATLWFVALLALVAVIIEAWIASALDRGIGLDGRIRARSALFSAEQHVFFDLTLGSTSSRGIELAPRSDAATAGEGAPPAETAPRQGPYIALDDRPYRIGDAMVQLQDGGGLCDLNTASPDAIGSVLESYGLSKNRARTLADALSSYRKKPAPGRDGAIEGGEYRRAGLPLPRHTALITPWEVLRIPGWEGSEALWRGSAPFYEIATPGPIGGLNANTASARMLTAFGGIDERAAAQIVLRRSVAPITDLRDIDTAKGRGGEDHAIGLRPSNIIRLKLTVPGEPLMRVTEVRLTANGLEPLRLDYAVELPPDLLPDTSVIVPLPEPPAAVNGDAR